MRGVITMVMSLTSTYQDELNKFNKYVTGGDFNTKFASASAFTQARAKLSPNAFIRLQEVAVSTFYKSTIYNKWEGYRVLAVDGTVVSLPFSKCIIDKFGSEDYIDKQGSPNSLSRASILYDVLNEAVIDAQIDAYRVSERSLFELHLTKFHQADLILADRILQQIF